MLGLGGLHGGVVDARYRIRDPGFYQLEGDERLYRDWKREGHGHRVDLHQAIVESCDTYYYEMAFRMGIDAMHAFGDNFSLGKRTGIDIPSERKGLWPSRTWKRAARGLAWYPGDSLNVGLGQGDVLATPLQLAAMTATMANRGRFIQPRLVEKIDGTETPVTIQDMYRVSDEHWDHIFNAMKDVVHSARGTAQSIRRGMKYKMAGKTGTAQVVGIAQGEEYDSEALKERQRDHALFVAFAPGEDPKIAVAVIVENGEKSSKAARVARRVIDRYLEVEAELVVGGDVETSQSEALGPHSASKTSSVNWVEKIEKQRRSS